MHLKFSKLTILYHGPVLSCPSIGAVTSIKNSLLVIAHSPDLSVPRFEINTHLKLIPYAKLTIST